MDMSVASHSYAKRSRHDATKHYSRFLAVNASCCLYLINTLLHHRTLSSQLHNVYLILNGQNTTNTLFRHTRLECLNIHRFWSVVCLHGSCRMRNFDVRRLFKTSGVFLRVTQRVRNTRDGIRYLQQRNERF